MKFTLFKKKKNEKPSEKKDVFFNLTAGLSKTRKIFTFDIDRLFASNKAIDDKLFENLEELLITSDIGIDLTNKMISTLRKKAVILSDIYDLKQILKQELISLFPKLSDELRQTSNNNISKKPYIIMVVGVNGTGKTTTLGKLAMKFSSQNKKVLIAAADTFRAAAIEQIEIWAERANASIIKHRQGADPAAVAFDAVQAAIARNADIVLIDTAGRLQTKKNLMEELIKIKRSIKKKKPDAPHEILMVLDATIGQNSISQVKLFHEAIGLTQIALTKLDGTAKGGIVITIANIFDLPIKYIGVGEKITDLQDFDAKLFVDALFEVDNVQ